MIVEFINKMRERLPLLGRLGLGVLILLLLWDIFLLDKGPAYTAAERFPGFWSIFGLAAASLLIVVAKTIGQVGLQADEDYYDK